MIIVSDTSPLCNLVLIDHLWLLEAIYQTVIIPTLVADELTAATHPAIPAILQLDWIQSRSPTDATIANQLQLDRHLQASKATLGEVGKHFLEDSVWAKAILTYLDKLSEEPNHGA